MMYLDVWRSGTFPEEQQVSECAVPIANTDRRMTEHSTSDSLGDVSWIQKAALQLYRRNVPLLHTSRYVISRDSVLPGLPCVSNASDKHWAEKDWVRRYSHLALFTDRSHGNPNVQSVCMSICRPMYNTHGNRKAVLEPDC